MKSGTSILSEDVIVNVTSPELVKASCVGSGEFIANTDIKSEDVKFDSTLPMLMPHARKQYYRLPVRAR